MSNLPFLFYFWLKNQYLFIWHGQTKVNVLKLFSLSQFNFFPHFYLLLFPDCSQQHHLVSQLKNLFSSFRWWGQNKQDYFVQGKLLLPSLIFVSKARAYLSRETLPKKYRPGWKEMPMTKHSSLFFIFVDDEKRDLWEDWPNNAVGHSQEITLNKKAENKSNRKFHNFLIFPFLPIWVYLMSFYDILGLISYLLVTIFCHFSANYCQFYNLLRYIYGLYWDILCHFR